MKTLGEVLSRKSQVKILDIGTGAGGFIGMIGSVFDDYSEIIGVDISEGAIKAARNNFDDGRIKFELMDSNDLEYSEGSFDVVCLSNSLHHLDDIKTALGEMYRVLNPGGYMVFNEMYSDVEEEKQLTHVKMHHFWGEIDSLTGITHNETFKRQEIVNLLDVNCDAKVKDVWTLKVDDQGDDTLSEDDMNFFDGILDSYVNKVKDHKDKEKYVLRADDLRNRLRTVGFKSASQLVVVMEK